MSKLNFSIDFLVPPKVMYNALIDKQEVQKYTRCKAEFNSQIGGQFSMLEGKIVGKFLDLDDKKFLIKMEWKMSNWNQPSIVQVIIKDRDDECSVNIEQTQIPNNVDINQLQAGWMNQIFKPMSLICGYAIDE